MHHPRLIHQCRSTKSGQDCRMTWVHMAVTVHTYCSETAKIFAPKCYNYCMKSIGVLVENSEWQFTIKLSLFILHTYPYGKDVLWWCTGGLLSEGP
jgi:hypothetical protein